MTTVDRRPPTRPAGRMPSPLVEPPFSTVIREASRAEHEEAENAGFGQALLGGLLTVDAYAELAAQTYLIYATLEEATAAQRTDPIGAAFVFDELLRLPALERDLAYLRGAAWRGSIEALPATTRYCDRLREVCFTWAGGFVAHQYTRYLGDLSGGQVIRRVLAREYGLADEGARFYVFEGIPKPKPFKDLYRARLDAAPWDATERTRIVAEVKLAFRLNSWLFADLGADMAGYLRNRGAADAFASSALATAADATS